MALVVTAALALAAFLAVGANGPADPTLERTGSTTGSTGSAGVTTTTAPAVTPRGQEGEPAVVAPTTRLPASVATATSPQATSPTTSARRQPVAGFGETGFVVRPGGSGAAAERCALLAETEAQLRQGLMGRRDLAGYDAMVFRFSFDSTGSFFMRNVPVPLDIAWFDADGRFVSSAEMAPCADREGCPLYAAERPYRYALEAEQGGLARLGVGGGSVLTLRPGCGSA